MSAAWPSRASAGQGASFSWVLIPARTLEKLWLWERHCLGLFTCGMRRWGDWSAQQSCQSSTENEKPLVLGESLSPGRGV